MKDAALVNVRCAVRPGEHFRFSDRGSSTCVFCIHGRPGNSLLMEPFDTWCEQQSYDCYRYDQFSCRDRDGFHGDSEQLLAILVKELYQHLSKFEGRDLLIVAHSFGAVLLCETLLRYEFAQQRIKIVLSGFCPEREEFLLTNQRRLDSYAREGNEHHVEQRFFDLHICGRRFLSAEQLQAFQMPPMGNISLRNSYLDLLSAMRCPVLITYGSEDICTDYQVAKICECLVDCHVVQFPGAAHYPFIERAQAYFHELDRFMSTG
ncbi:alpha/beta hydrolase [Pseudomonas sp. SWRI154]|uniref:alpha/beta fold hydrolase n=1 Tax=Pseudomonas sp. SWRI154 TaxID=2745501 RepID=UPI00164660D7|nr:alpha/beta hydrolase [Pseudomonas sp. SWRI154]MBC3365816.1 alpha/beta fold hydrolase [Pseudomonas sp. SWRI154]